MDLAVRRKMGCTCLIRKIRHLNVLNTKDNPSNGVSERYGL